MKIEASWFDAVKLLTPERHEDGRGFFSETWNRRDFAALGIDRAFVQDNHSLSRGRSVVRGLHFQLPPFAQANSRRPRRVRRGPCWMRERFGAIIASRSVPGGKAWTRC